MAGTVVTIITEAVRKESGKWFELHNRLEPIIRAVDGLDLSESAFWCGEPAEINARINSVTYNDFQNSVLTSFRAALVEFDQIGRALVKIANEYDRQDSVSSLDINQAYTLP
jgi:hypothetical protein